MNPNCLQQLVRPRSIAVTRRGGGARRSNDDTIAAPSLRFVHRAVGGRQQAIGIHPIVRAWIHSGDSDGSAERPCRAALEYQHADPLAQGCRRGGRRVGREDGEFVSTPSSAEIGGARLRLNRAGERAKGGVTGSMPMAIVDRLEPIEVDHQHRQRRPVRSCSDKLGVDAFEKSPRIAQPGERVRTGQPREPIRLPPQKEAKKREHHGGGHTDIDEVTAIERGIA
jgi:hypothetical protein